MLKTDRYSFLPLLSILLAFGSLQPSRAQQQIVETEALGPFTTLLCNGPVKVELIPADENRLQIMSWGIEAKGINWRVKNYTLDISTRKGLVNKRAFADIKLYYKELNRIEIIGGEVKTTDPIVGSSLYLSAESSVGRMELVVECNDITIHTSGDNTVQVSGTTEYASYRSRLGSRIECLGLSAGSVTASASGKSEIQLKVSELLDAKAVTGANIFFSGEPETLHIRKAAMGGVEWIDEP